MFGPTSQTIIFRQLRYRAAELLLQCHVKHPTSSPSGPICTHTLLKTSMASATASGFPEFVAIANSEAASASALATSTACTATSLGSAFFAACAAPVLSCAPADSVHANCTISCTSACVFSQPFAEATTISATFSVAASKASAVCAASVLSATRTALATCTADTASSCASSQASAAPTAASETSSAAASSGDPPNNAAANLTAAQASASAASEACAAATVALTARTVAASADIVVSMASMTCWALLANSTTASASVCCGSLRDLRRQPFHLFCGCIHCNPRFIFVICGQIGVPSLLCHLPRHLTYAKREAPCHRSRGAVQKPYRWQLSSLLMKKKSFWTATTMQYISE